MSQKQSLFFHCRSYKKLIEQSFSNRESFLLVFNYTVSISSLFIQVKMADAGTGLTNSQLPQFNGKNHIYWSIIMKALFASQGIWLLLETGYAERAEATTLAALTVAERDQLKSDRKKDAKALFFLLQSVHESVFPRIAATTKSKEPWDILKTTYQGMEKVKTTKLQMLRRDFENLSMKESKTIDSFSTQVIGLIT